MADDFDLDGVLDLLVAERDDASYEAQTDVNLHRGDGSLGFETQQVLVVDSTVMAVASLDLDIDGDSDLVVATTGSDEPELVLENLGDGRFELRQQLQAGQVMGSAVWDIDRDGLSDVVLVDAGSGRRIEAHLSNGDFSFTPMVLVHDAPQIFGGPAFVRLADGTLAMVVAAWINGIYVYHEKTSGVWEVLDRHMPGWPMTRDYCDVITGDLNQDGHAEIMVAAGWANTIDSAFYNETEVLALEEGTFESMGTLASQPTWSVALVDDGDGLLDVVELNWSTWSWPDAGDRFFRNVGTPRNLPPSTPIPVTEQGRVFDCHETVVLEWLAAEDDTTPAAALTYRVRVGTTPNARDVVSGLGPVGRGDIQTTRRLLRLSPGTYHWDVIAIDAAWTAGEPSAERSFTIETCL